MRIWISKGSEVPVREQLTTQVIIAIASGELKPNEKLPSTRELARRFNVHSNTINAAYRELARRGWVDFRKGSGVYVRAMQTDVRLDGKLELDHLISAFITVARTKGFSLSEIRSRVKTWLELQPPDHFLLIEPDADLRSILLAEIHEATGFPASGTSLQECADPALLAGAAPVVLYAWAEEVRAKLPRDAGCMALHSRALSEWLTEVNLPKSDRLVMVVSAWPELLRLGRASLIAAGFDPGVLSFRSRSDKNWRSAIHPSMLVLADTLTRRELPARCHSMVFRILSDSSVNELRTFVDQFLGGRRNLAADEPE
ncbi:MAG TPA: GntR family transcriptional regulator [Acidobacteriota bacterium]